MGIFLKGRFDNPWNGVAERFVLREKKSYAVLDLLRNIGEAVGPVDLHGARRLVDGGVVASGGTISAALDEAARRWPSPRNVNSYAVAG